ncbi:MULTISPECIES: NAD-dependent protein deacetylase [Pseudomonas]|jgi:NAD-dependent protein deacetylases, SIR2 family|uniref:NAD-dependent protein deacetylase n=1 Tax=Pseudomonas brassicacearum (strain NFM421) TaxID=994484 RepID=F2K9R7_PSEBN|nr:MULTISPECIES: NAD-dependent protein deacetylase [Pseudomonas]EIK64161.1 NAD-dependent deacetylase [Pseudomonas fluorescens Q8r1-96]KIR18196.1 NAD-dependent protein deacetylase [Pseudomonas fluorescens]AEA68129.1 putative NAD-dependent deacetylase regulatory protein [Pseudomonas brassicacearum subsp. brassicacearum NFM421]ALQ02792.1 NAD-dependent protein deacetylase of SIR2 family [Pseudomonas brassicacearum]AOS38337.1 NAD-dependent deacetylase [Pseudomonas brassicacearum]
MPDDFHREPLDQLQAYLAGRRFLVLTGAGISTPSGIPDYRDSDGVRRGRQPMMYQEFLAQAEARRRYWARAMLGWPRVRQARPNAAHEALAQLQARQRITGLITQNVDTLHDQAGSQDVIELHGSLHRVLCLDCGQRSERQQIQQLMETENPYLAGVDAVQAPDGDTLLDPAFEARFQVPRCPHCGGERLKPDVVFFGENVAPLTATRAVQAVEQADGLLVVGSSLMAYSAFRLCRAIKDQGKPLLAINRGKTRADELLDLKLEEPCEQLLPLLI